MTLQPLYDRVVLKRNEADTQSRGGILIPTAAQEKSTLCTVVAAGPGRLNPSGVLTPLSVGPGMTVLIGKWSGDEVRVGNVDHLIVSESDILAVVL